jgi:signal transduction histidine kinase
VAARAPGRAHLPTPDEAEITSPRCEETVQERRLVPCGRDDPGMARPDPAADADVRDELIAATNHEMRTTLTAVLGLAQLLRGGVAGPVNAEQDSLLARIEANGRRQLRLVENLLALQDANGRPHHEADGPAVAVAGGRHAEYSRAAAVDLRHVVRRAVAELDEPLQGRRLRLDIDLGEVALLGTGDHRHLQQAVANVLDNAVRFTPDGGTVTVRCAGRGGTVTVVVADTGPGMGSDELAAVLDRFVRGSSADLSAGQRLGLGLTAARRLLEAQGGRLDLASTPGEGTRVELSLPAAG